MSHERDNVANHRQIDCLLNNLFRPITLHNRENIKSLPTGLSWGESTDPPVIGGWTVDPLTRARNAEIVSCHDANISFFNAWSNYAPHAMYCSYSQCWKFPQVRRSEADNFGGGLGTFCWFFFNFMFIICDSRHEDLQLFWLSFQHCIQHW